VTEYYPTLIEVMMSIGLWAMGFFVLTILLKGAIGILVGDIRFKSGAKTTSNDAANSGEIAAHGSM
jgi:molybdopterin-containing oxidoreductase family membrane subunit